MMMRVMLKIDDDDNKDHDELMMVMMMIMIRLMMRMRMIYSCERYVLIHREMSEDYVDARPKRI